VVSTLFMAVTHRKGFAPAEIPETRKPADTSLNQLPERSVAAHSPSQPPAQSVTRLNDGFVTKSREVTGMALSLRDLAPDPAAFAQSFGELAQGRALPVFQDTTKLLQRLPRDVQPGDPNLKEFRKELQRVRDLVDVFAHALPEEGQVRLRKLLDQGYEAIGAYKDLVDAGRLLPEALLLPLTTNDVRAHLDAVNAWKDEFLSPQRQADFEELLSSAKLKGKADPNRDVSRFFWGAVPDSTLPKSKRTGLENIAKLALGLADVTRDAGARALKVFDPVTDEEIVHDFRKQLRNATNLMANFPELVPPGLKPALMDLGKVVEAYGEVEDRNVALAFALKRGATDAAALLRTDIMQKWDEVKELHRSLHVDALLSKLQTELDEKPGRQKE
jgi:CHAD domain-containing protein